MHLATVRRDDTSDFREDAHSVGSNDMRDDLGRHEPRGHEPRRYEAPGETRICFSFLNKGQCDRAGSCRFRHLTPDHPDAQADRIRASR